MIQQAKMKFSNRKFSDRMKLKQGDLHNIDLPDETFDLTFNFHNVLGFVEDPQKVMNELVRVTKKGGVLVTFAPNLYHNIFFNTFLGNLDEAKHAVNNHKGRFTKNMPYIHLFTPETLKTLYYSQGVTNAKVIGFPLTLYPGFQETQIEGDSEKNKNLLSDKENLKRVFEQEKKLLFKEEAAARGNNLFAWGIK